VQGIGSIEMETLSMTPLVFTMNNFLSAEECQHILTKSERHLKVP
jgi:hypothetical protein